MVQWELLIVLKKYEDTLSISSKILRVVEDGILETSQKRRKLRHNTPHAEGDVRKNSLWREELPRMLKQSQGDHVDTMENPRETHLCFRNGILFANPKGRFSSSEKGTRSDQAPYRS